MYCEKCNSLLNENNICPVCESNTTLKKNSELSQAIEELKNGNQEAFNIFYNYTSKYVYSRAKTLSHDEQTANDVMQEVYISAFKNINSLKSNDSVFAWLRTITFNASNHIIKKNKTQIVLSEEAEEMFEALPDENEQIEEDYMNKQDIEIIHDCINRLSDEQRIVLLAYYYDNLKVEEIAQLLQISSGTVKSRLFTARKNLKKFIEEEENKNGYKLHSFSGLSLALALRKSLQDNMNNFTINNALYQSIYKKLNTPINTSSSTDIIKPKSKFLNTISKNKTFHTLAKVGVKKIIFSTVAAVTATGIISGTVALITLNLNDKPTSNHLSYDSFVEKPYSEEFFSSEEVSEEKSSKSENSESNTLLNKKDNTIDTTKPSDCIIYRSGILSEALVILNQKTTYFGYPGYFTTNSNINNAMLTKFGLATTNKSAYLCPTEFNVNNRWEETIYFVINKEEFTPQKLINLVDEKGRNKIETDVVDYNSYNNQLPSNCVQETYPYRTIKLHQKTTYYGYPGYFTMITNLNDVDLVKYGLGDSNSLVALCPTEYYDIDSGYTIHFAINSDVVYPGSLMGCIDDGNCRGLVPANTIGEKTYNHFDKPLNEYLFHTDGSTEMYQDSVQFYTTERNEKIETEIYAKFIEHFGYEAVVSNFNRLGKYYINDSEIPYDIYIYHLNGPWKSNITKEELEK